jgi:hypothetical protein
LTANNFSTKEDHKFVYLANHFGIIGAIERKSATSVSTHEHYFIFGKFDILDQTLKGVFLGGSEFGYVLGVWHTPRYELNLKLISITANSIYEFIIIDHDNKYFNDFYHRMALVQPGWTQKHAYSYRWIQQTDHVPATVDNN